MNKLRLRNASYIWRVEQIAGFHSLTIHHHPKVVNPLPQDGVVPRWRELPPVPLHSSSTHLGVCEGAKILTASRWLKKCCPDLPHSLVQKLFRLRKVRMRLSQDPNVGGFLQSSLVPRVSAKNFVMEGAVLYIPTSIEWSKSDGDQSNKKIFHKPSAQELSWLRSIVLYKDAHVIIINKPHGLAVQGGTSVGKNLDSLMDAALSYDYIEGPRLVHRLDKETSGLMVLGRTYQSTIILHELLRAKTVAASSNMEVNRLDKNSIQRSYWALVIGTPQKSQGLITVPLIKAVSQDGKCEKIKLATKDCKENLMEAMTEYQVLGPSLFGCTWMELRPFTGRKHQLRVHCAEVLGTPILGDKKYGWQINRDWSKQCYIKMSRSVGIEKEPSDTVMQGQCKGKVTKGNILSKTPYLHLHCRQLKLPKFSDDTAKQDDTLSLLEFAAPLPPHMETSWSIQPVVGMVL